VLLADPEKTLLEPLMERLLLTRNAATENLWKNGLWGALTVREAL
jgi:hypothetical protein